MQFYFICCIATCKLCYLSCISIYQVFEVFNFWNLICLHFLKITKTLSGFFFMANHTKHPDGLSRRGEILFLLLGRNFRGPCSKWLVKTSIQLDPFCLKKYLCRRNSSMIRFSAPPKLKFNLDASNEVFWLRTFLLFSQFTLIIPTFYGIRQK